MALYRARQREIDTLLGETKKKLRRHAERAERTPENWGHAGDLGHVTETLKGLNRFLG